jgi:guanylate kinase
VNLGLKDKGLLVVLSAPAGCGKDTVLAELKKQDENVKQSISMTTRAPREGEQDGVDYYFTSVEDFEKNISEDGFLEYVKYGVNYYGTPKKAIEEMIDSGKTVVLKIEVEGAGNVRKIYPDAISVFIMPPSLKELKKRLVSRGTEDRDKVLDRFKRAYKEINELSNYNYVVINDEVVNASSKMSAILESEKCRIDRIEEVFLNNVEEEIHELLMDDKDFVNEDIKI